MDSGYQWVEEHKKIVQYLNKHKNDPKHLIELLKKADIKNGLEDKDEDGKKTLEVMEPFTFLRLFYKYGDNSYKHLNKISEDIGFEKIETNTKGVPATNAKSAWVFPFEKDRKGYEIKLLNELFEEVLGNNVRENTFNKALEIQGIAIAKLTEVLYLVNPENYFPYDGPTKEYLKDNFEIELKEKNYQSYMKLLEELKEKIQNKKNYEISYDAWVYYKKKHNKQIININEILNKIYKDKYIEIAIKAYKLYIKTDNYKKTEKNVDDINIKNFFKDFEINFEEFNQNDLKLIINKMSEKYNLSKNEIKNFINLISDEGEYRFNIYTAIKYLSDLSQNFYKLKNDLNKFIDFIKSSDKEFLNNIKEKYSNEDRVNRIRYEIIDYYLNNDMLDIEIIENIKEKINDEYAKNILQSWNNFLILYPFYYLRYQHRIKNELLKISKFIKSIDKIKELNLKESPVNLFGGQNIQEMAWFVLYPKENKSYTNSQQLSFFIDNKDIVFGLDFGNNIKKEKDMEKVNVDYIDFNITNKMKEKYLQVYNDFISFEPKDGVDKPPYDFSNDPDTPFLSEEKFYNIIEMLKRKKNIILQGPPGVGKTFIAKKIAYQMMGEKNNENIEMIQFHQSYSYEDFIQGYRPTEDGGFNLNNGVFYEFCEKAKGFPKEDFFFIIDEINRGNMSKIFGELMMLIEADKRGPENKIKLTYKGDYFYIPENLHIIGTMNTADRSLAIVDYALRRRFAFIDIEPNFDNKFENFLKDKKDFEYEFIQKHIKSKIINLNTKIENDNNLGKDYKIGHSYFCTYSSNNNNHKEKWLKEVYEYEIVPLLEEMWFDEQEQCKEEKKKLLEGLDEQ